MTQQDAVVSPAPMTAEATVAGMPALSVILFTPAGYEEIRTTLRHLVAQSIVDRIELVLVTAQPDELQLPLQIPEAFHTVRVVGVPEFRSLAAARARAVPHATAPVVAFAEDHSFPEPGWAQALLAGHARGYDGVAPRMKNGNPDALLSWVALFLHFGGVVHPAGGFETDSPTASHNMSYRRDALLELGEDLERRMLAETFLNQALRARGHRLWVEPAAVTRHMNISYLRPLLRHGWLGGRIYGALRCSFGKWSVARRLVYTFASPLIPLVRLRRAVRTIRHAGYARLLPRALLPIIVILIVDTIGEVAGYLFGAGTAVLAYSDYECRRYRFVLPSDRALWV